MLRGGGELVEPCDAARRQEELSDGFLVRALDALEATVAAHTGPMPGVNEQKRMLAAIVAADMGGRLDIDPTNKERLRVGAKLFKQASEVRTRSLAGLRRARVEAQAAAAGDAELTALLAKQLAESEAAEAAAFAELDREVYLGLHELGLPEPAAAVDVQPAAADAEDDGDDEELDERARDFRDGWECCEEEGLAGSKAGSKEKQKWRLWSLERYARANRCDLEVVQMLQRCLRQAWVDARLQRSEFRRMRRRVAKFERRDFRWRQSQCLECFSNIVDHTHQSGEDSQSESSYDSESPDAPMDYVREVASERPDELVSRVNSTDQRSFRLGTYHGME